MKLTLDALTVLDAIERRGSFAAAAEALFRVPSAVSYTMQKLEQDLGTAIFDRSGHRAVLTPAGKTLLDEGRRLLLATEELECQVKRIATGWETELRIAVDTIVPMTALLPLTNDFYATHTEPNEADTQRKGTQLKFLHEVLGGTWDALATGRADLIIGASGDGPAGGGFSSLPLTKFNMVFAVAPSHPLAAATKPLTSAEILKHRAVSIADSSRQLAPRSVGLLSGQETLNVPDMHCKLQAQIQGLGVGYLPQHWVQTAVDEQRLIIKLLDAPPTGTTSHVAWRSDNQGKALQWFVEKLKQPDIQAQLISCR